LGGIIVFIVFNVLNYMYIEISGPIFLFSSYLIFYSVINYNKIILSFEERYAQAYLSDIIFNISNIYILFVFFEEIRLMEVTIAYLLSASIVVLYQFIYIPHNIKSILKTRHLHLKVIIKNSLKLNTASSIYGMKDIVIANTFITIGDGLYSVYSYANKFSSIIVQVINAPILTVYTTKVSRVIASSLHEDAKSQLKKVWGEVTLLYVICTVVAYFILPFIIAIVLSGSIDEKQIDFFLYVFLLISLFNFIITAEAPLIVILNMYHEYDYAIKVNAVFITSILAFSYFSRASNSYDFILFGIISSQIINLVLYLLRYKFVFNKKTIL